MLERRTFLRGLTTLPLIGGAVTLLGQPTRAAVPFTDEQISRYAAFVISESDLAMRRLQANGTFHRYRVTDAMERYRHTFPGADDIAFRAPVILSAAGVPLTPVQSLSP